MKKLNKHFNQTKSTIEGFGNNLYRACGCDPICNCACQTVTSTFSTRNNNTLNSDIYAYSTVYNR